MGHDNPVTALSELTGSVANGVLQVTNQSTNTTTQDATAITAANNSNGSPTIRASNNRGSPAMELNVACQSLSACTRGAPMTVNSRTKVDLLNADLLDGMDSTELSISGLERVVGSYSAFDSNEPKQAFVGCPPGKRVLGGGPIINGEPGKVVVTLSVPSNTADGWVVEAWEIGAGTTGNWSLHSEATCANAQ